ncbi:MAG: mechanosensitive ion channel, partial [Anaerolineaceae bacterium]|nr:mechanosensitive ion channel [Anaerolineaceae bacterium]
MNPFILLAQAGGAAAGKAVEPVAEAVDKFPFGINPEMFPEFLRGTFLGIQYWQYMAAFLCILLGLAAKKICEFIFEHYVLPAARKTRVKFDLLLSEAVYKPAALGLALLGLWGAIVLFHLPVEPTNLRKFATGLLKILLAMDFMWFVFRLVDVLAFYLIGAAEKTESKLDDQLVPIIKKSLKVFVAVLVFVVVVQNLGYSVSSLLAGLGIGGLALAMAAKDTLANLFGGIVIFTDRPFCVGDWVKIGDVEGTIEQIG